MAEEAQRCLVTLAARLKMYNSENEARTNNKLFSTNTAKVYTVLRNGNQSVEQPDPPNEETGIFWEEIWKKDASYNNKAKWIAKLKADHQESVIQQQPMAVSENDLRLRVTWIKDGTAPEPDMIHTYWLKKLTSLQKRLACQMEKLVTKGDDEM